MADDDRDGISPHEGWLLVRDIIRGRVGVGLDSECGRARGGRDRLSIACLGRLPGGLLSALGHQVDLFRAGTVWDTDFFKGVFDGFARAIV